MNEFFNNTHRQIFTYNKNIGHLFVPNLNARIINENGGYYVNTNSLGFRSDIEFKQKKEKHPRILFFGDSNTAADGVSNSERFSDLICDNLDDVETYNFALGGSGHSEQFLVYEKIVKDFE